MTSEAILTAIITGGITLVGVYFQNHKTIAVIETKLEHLTNAVNKHNNFAERIPVIEEQIKMADNRIKKLEKVS